MGELVAAPLIVCGDDEIALDAAFPRQSGVLIVAGTGSNAVARTSTGERVNVGGWGPALGDEGSAFWIGQQALRAAFHAWDRGQPALFLQRVTEHWQVTEIWQIVEKAHALPPPDFAVLAPIVNTCAEQGDRVCLEVLAAAGQELAEMGALAFAKMRDLESGTGVAGTGVAFTGSVLGSSSIVREQMIESLRRMLPTVHVLPHAVDPIMGAVLAARAGLAEQANAASPQDHKREEKA
jgi:glucosamine kinase